MNNQEDIKLRDLIAIPIWILATFLDYVAVLIGGRWTVRMYIEQAGRITKRLSEIK